MKEQMKPIIAHIINIFPAIFGILLIKQVKTNAIIASMNDTTPKPIRVVPELASKLVPKVPISITPASLNNANILPIKPKMNETVYLFCIFINPFYMYYV